MKKNCQAPLFTDHCSVPNSRFSYKAQSCQSVHLYPSTNQFRSLKYPDITSTICLPTDSMYPTQKMIGGFMQAWCECWTLQIYSQEKARSVLIGNNIPRIKQIAERNDTVELFSRSGYGWIQKVVIILNH